MDELKLILETVKTLGESGKQAFYIYLAYKLLGIMAIGAIVLLALHTLLQFAYRFSLGFAIENIVGCEIWNLRRKRLLEVIAKNSEFIERGSQ